MKIGIIGTGYVGLVAGACLAESGNDVICADIVEDKIARLNAGEVPIYEPGLEPLIERNAEAGRLTFTTDVPACVRASDILFIAVGTPPGEDGSADLQHVLSVARVIGQSMTDEKIVITKSTVPVGTAKLVREAIVAETDHPVHVCSNPEFLKEGAAIDDFMKPDRVVLGVDSEHAAEVLRDLYSPFVRTGHEIMIMDVPSAEITKYAANSMLATRISFMNSIARLCEETGADVDAVRRGVGSDGRIGPSFLFPGVGYGGSCLEGSETVLVRDEHGIRLMELRELFDERAPAPDSVPGDLEPDVVWADDLDVLSWRAGVGTVWRPAQAITRRWYEGEILEVRTKLGRRVRCTPDHPFVVSDGEGAPASVKLARDLDGTDWVPLASGAPDPGEEAPVVVSGADRVERLLALVKPADRPAVEASLASQAKRIAPTGHRPAEDAAWLRVVRTTGEPYRGWVYSVEVPSTETFVTTGGLVVHNCFPKDVKALVKTMRDFGVDPAILAAVEAVNDTQKSTLLTRLVDRLGEDLAGVTVAVWGLSFKPNTDDMREAPSLVTIEGLLERGARVVAHDPVASGEARHHLGDRIEYVTNNYDALGGAEALVIHTEWYPYRRPDFARMRAAMARPLILDGRNLWDPADMEEQGFEYVSIGRRARPLATEA